MNWTDRLGLEKDLSGASADAAGEHDSGAAAAHAAGEKFIKDEHDAARKQFEEDETAMVLLERCGRICCKEDGKTFYATVAARKWSWSKGLALGCSPEKSPECKDDDKEIGWWHTHPGRTRVETEGRTNEEKKKVLRIFEGGPFNQMDKNFVDGMISPNTGKHLPRRHNPDGKPLAMTRVFEGKVITVYYLNGEIKTHEPNVE
ncbi:hypothetical protein ACFQY0_20685 [Haloferula chungangensis]|uniref:JAB domain-containing protein n=1 Tax=Haloferula chungangensis TaxID=1048331 RepID=A0ABW2LE39_9BACT